MALPPNMRPKQDMPPPGGFKVFDVRRKVRPGRITSLGLIGLTGAAILYGSHIGMVQRRKRRARIVDKRERRSYILPFIQTEEDVRYVLHEQKQLEIEEYLMRDYPDWEVGKSDYHSNFFIRHHPKIPEFARSGEL